MCTQVVSCALLKHLQNQYTLSNLSKNTHTISYLQYIFDTNPSNGWGYWNNQPITISGVKSQVCHYLTSDIQNISDVNYFATS